MAYDPTAAYQPAIKNYQDLLNSGSYAQPYDSQITDIGQQMTTTEKKYADALSGFNDQYKQQQEQLGQQQTTSLGTQQVQQANAGVAQTQGTQEMAASEAIKRQYANLGQNLYGQYQSGVSSMGLQEDQAKQQYQSMISSLLGQKETSKENILGAISNLQGQSAQALQNQKQFEASQGLENAKLTASQHQVVSLNGKTVLMNTATGDVIKDLGVDPNAVKGWSVTPQKDPTGLSNDVQGYDFTDNLGRPVSAAQYFYQGTGGDISQTLQSMASTLGSSKNTQDKTISDDITKALNGDSSAQKRVDGYVKDMPWIFGGVKF